MRHKILTAVCLAWSVLGFALCCVMIAYGGGIKWAIDAALNGIAVFLIGNVLYTNRRLNNVQIEKLVQKYGIYLNEQGDNFGLSEELVQKHRWTWNADNCAIGRNNASILNFLLSKR